MKKLIFILLIFLNVGLFAQFSGGSGTSASPYLISTPLQLDSVRNHKHSYFLITDTLDMTSYSWTPIDTLYGQIDGGGNIIKNLSFTGNVDANGYRGLLIQILNGGEVHHVEFLNPYGRITNSISSTPGAAGIISALSFSATLDSIVIVNPDFRLNQSSFAGSGVGGLTGGAQAISISRCAIISGVISDSGTGEEQPAGLVGNMGFQTSISISKCYVQGTIIQAMGASQDFPAGLCGNGTNTGISDSYVNAKFNVINSGSGQQEISGIVNSEAGNQLTRVYVIDSLAASPLPYALPGTFVSPYFTNLSTDKENYCDTTISNKFSFALIPSDTGSHYISDASMKLQSTYSGWDFNTTWLVSSSNNNGYPLLIWTGFVITNPFAGELFTIGDSVKLQVSSTPDTLIAYINYGNGFDSLGVFLDSTKFQVDTIGQNVQFKVVDKQSRFTALSGVFQVYPVRTLILDTVYNYNTLNFVVIHSGVLSTTSYYSSDSLRWTKIGTNSLGLLIKKDTLPYTITFPMRGKSYFKIVELYDTTTYDYTPATYLSAYSPVPNSTQNCYNWQYSGFGAVWLRDVSCGWTSGIYQEAGFSSASISGIGETSVITNYIIYLENSSQAALEACCFGGNNVTWITDRSITPVMPGGAGSPFATTSVSNPVTVNGRQFWWVNNILYQKDLINNVTTQIYNLSYSMGLAGNFTGPAGVTQWGNFLLFASLPGYGYPDVIILNALPYPPLNNYSPLSSEYTLVTNISAFRNTLRGIIPKGITSFYPPLGH